MRDYEELVRQLRKEADKWCTNCCYRAEVFTCVAPDDRKKDCDVYTNLRAADVIEELTRENESLAKSVNEASEILRRRWIPVTERLPEQGRRYLVIRFDEVTKTQFIDILWHDAHDLWWNRLYKGNYNVTHWMPLPEPPKEEK